MNLSSVWSGRRQQPVNVTGSQSILSVQVTQQAREGLSVCIVCTPPLSSGQMASLASALHFDRSKQIEPNREFTQALMCTLVKHFLAEYEQAILPPAQATGMLLASVAQVFETALRSSFSTCCCDGLAHCIQWNSRESWDDDETGLVVA